MEWLDFDEIESLASIGGYAADVRLSSETAAFLIAAVSFFDDMRRWHSSDETLSVAEIDNIQALIAQANYELTREVNAMVVGTVVMWLGETIPEGWLDLRGQFVDRLEYPELYETLTGNTPTSGTFKLPDYYDATPRGGVVEDGLGNERGTNDVTLGLGNIPSHRHMSNYPDYTTVAISLGGVNVAIPNGTLIESQQTSAVGGTQVGALPISVRGRYVPTRFLIRALP